MEFISSNDRVNNVFALTRLHISRIPYVPVFEDAYKLQGKYKGRIEWPGGCIIYIEGCTVRRQALVTVVGESMSAVEEALPSLEKQLGLDETLDVPEEAEQTLLKNVADYKFYRTMISSAPESRKDNAKWN